MAIEIRGFSVTIPAGTTLASGFTADLSFPARVVTQIDILIPPGPRGEVGVGIGTAGVITIPRGGTSYIVADDKYFTFPLEEQIDAGSWTLFGYNTGSFNHTITVYFHLDPIAAPATAAVGAGSIPIGTSGGGTGAGGGAGGGGGGSEGGGGGAPPPVVIPPPPGAPGGGAPLLLPPPLPALPGTAPTPLDPDTDTLLVGVSELNQVWYLDGGSYTQLTDQGDLNALLATADATVALSAAMHAAIQAALTASVTVSLGEHVLTGTLTYTHGHG